MVIFMRKLLKSPEYVPNSTRAFRLYAPLLVYWPGFCVLGVGALRDTGLVASHVLVRPLELDISGSIPRVLF